MAKIYVSPTGSGDKSGSSAANAMPVGSIDKAIALAGPGGFVLMLADKGAYNLTSSLSIYHGGTDGAAVTVKGVNSLGQDMNVQIYGSRPATYVAGMPAGNELFRLLGGADNLVFENMSFNNIGTVFRAGSDIRNITIAHMTADNVQRFFEDYASSLSTTGTATVTNLTIRDVEVHGFSKGVIRLQYDTHSVLIEDVYGDSERQEGDGIPIGVHLDGTVHDVVIRKTVMENAQASGSYWNGDGFATERNVYRVTFEDTIARGNGDGGYDLKSSSTTLIRAVAEDNGRNFRLWAEATLIDSIGLDPHMRGGTTGKQAQLQIMDGAHVQVKGGSFADAGTSTQVVLTAGTGSVTFTNTAFLYASTARLAYGPNIVGIDASLVKTVSSASTYSTSGWTLLDQLPNRAPDSMSGTGGIVTENAAVGTWVAKMVAHDADHGDSLTYTLVNDAGGAFRIDSKTGDIFVVNGSSLNFELGQTKTITVRASDNHGLGYNKNVSIAVTDIAEGKILNGTSGNDVLKVTSNEQWTVTGLSGDDQITTLGGNDFLTGGAGNDQILAGAGDDIIRFSGASEGFDIVNGETGNDRIIAVSTSTVIGLRSVTGVEAISGNGFSGVTIAGSPGADTLNFSATALDGIVRISGGDGNDTITGSTASDTILGGTGADRLSGYTGRDTLSGGDGADIFDFNAIAESRPGSSYADVITDFVRGVDRIDLSTIDASSIVTGNQAFSFIGTSGFTGVAGQLRYSTSSTVTHVYGDVDGNGVADFQVQLTGGLQLTSSDFFL